MQHKNVNNVKKYKRPIKIKIWRVTWRVTVSNMLEINQWRARFLARDIWIGQGHDIIFLKFVLWRYTYMYFHFNKYSKFSIYMSMYFWFDVVRLEKFVWKKNKD